MEALAGKRIGFIGAGAMAGALVGGLVGSGTVSPAQVVATNRCNRERLDGLARRWGVEVTPRKDRVVSSSDLVILAVKPADMLEVLSEIGNLVRPDQAVISVAAGISIDFVEGFLREGTAVIRAMPNTSCQVGEAITALALGRHASVREEEMARSVFASVGKVVMVKESDIDAVTGLSGSGPAYVYLMIETLVDAGVQVGLDADIARTLAVQTVFGAAKMVMDTGLDPAHLRQQVSSPGGTTMAALKVLEERGFQNALVDAVRGATIRSRELGQSWQRNGAVRQTSPALVGSSVSDQAPVSFAARPK